MVAPAALYVPAGQEAQVALVEAGKVEDHFPAGQNAQGDVELKKVPEGHGGQMVIRSRAGAESPRPSATFTNSVQEGAPIEKGGVLFSTNTPLLRDTKVQL